MKQMMNWYVVYTKVDHERKIAQVLNYKGIETYCPQCAFIHKEQKAAKVFPKFLFPRWVFIYCSQEHLTEVMNLSGVAHVLYRYNRPAVVSQEEISTIRYVLREFREIELQKTGIRPQFSLYSVQDSQRVFYLSSLGYSLCIKGEAEGISPALKQGQRVLLGNPPMSARKISSLLANLPALLADRVMKHSIPLSARLEQQ